MWPMHQQSLNLLCARVLGRFNYKEMHYLTFDLDLWVKVTWNVAQYPLHHVTYAPAKFEVATCDGFGEDAFTRKCIIWPLTLTLVSMSHKMLPSTRYIMRPMHLWSLKLLHVKVWRRCIYKKLHYLTFGPDTWNVAQRPLNHMTCAHAKSNTLFDLDLVKMLIFLEPHLIFHQILHADTF